MIKGRIINKKHFCHCGRLMKETGKNLDGKKIYTCFIRKHTLKEEDFIER